MTQEWVCLSLCMCVCDFMQRLSEQEISDQISLEGNASHELQDTFLSFRTNFSFPPASAMNEFFRHDEHPEHERRMNTAGLRTWTTLRLRIDFSMVMWAAYRDVRTDTQSAAAFDTRSRDDSKNMRYLSPCLTWPVVPVDQSYRHNGQSCRWPVMHSRWTFFFTSGLSTYIRSMDADDARRLVNFVHILMTSDLWGRFGRPLSPH